MSKHLASISEKELDILNTLWRAGAPLKIRDLIVLCNRPKKWSDGYIHTLINHLLDKKLIQVASYEMDGNIKSRLFEPTISAEEYAASRLKDSLMVSKKNKLSNIIQYLLDDGDIESAELLDDIEKLIWEYEEPE